MVALAGRSFEITAPLGADQVGSVRAWLRSSGTAHRLTLSRISQVEETLTGWLAAARQAWPGLDQSDARFLSYLVERIPSKGLAGIELDVAGLYLACACADGSSSAMTIFEREYFRDVDQVLCHVNSFSDLNQEVKQLLRQELFVSHKNTLPAIAQFAGRGSLRAWFRVTMTRTAFRLNRQLNRQTPVDDVEHLANSVVAADPEVEHIKRLYGKVFESAMRRAVGQLLPDERAVLQYYFVERLTIDQIGELLHVHRVTALRKIDRAKKRLGSFARKLIKRELRSSRSEFESLVRLLQSTLDIGNVREVLSSSET